VIAFRNFLNIFSIPELVRKLSFTLVVLAVFRLGNVVPVFGINTEALAALMAKKSSLLGGLFSFLDLFSGGNLKGWSIFALGITPYISASIVMQLLSLSVPSLEQKMKEGEYGRKVINQYTRYLALGVALFQSASFALMAEKNNLALVPGWGFRLSSIFLLTVGAMFCMWLAEQISLHGLGNGSSMLIFAGIVARFPADIIAMIGSIQTGLIGIGLATILVIIIALIVCTIIYLEKGERRIPVQYTRRIVGNRVYGGQGAFIPFRINNAGVLPVIYSQGVLQLPYMLATFLGARFVIFNYVAESLAPTGLLYNVLDFLLIIAFSFLYMTIQFNPDELAENMKKSGGFIPGLRPGKKTAEFFSYLLGRIGLVGAMYLAGLAIVPNIVYKIFSLPFYLSALSGTGLLILVGVALELAAQIEAYLLENRYRGFLTVGRFKSRIGGR